MLFQQKQVDQHYFDLIRFRHRELAEIVKRELQSKHAIIVNDGSYVIKMESVIYLRSKLKKMGLDEDKDERVFPGRRIPTEYKSHFHRGFNDARARIYDVDGTTQIALAFNQKYLMGSHRELKAFAHLLRGPPVNGRIKYSHKDAVRYYNYLYSDWEFVKRRRLYVGSNLEKIRENIDHVVQNPSKANALKRINRAQKLLRTKSATEVSSIVGYTHPPAFFAAFKHFTKQTPGEFKQR